MQRSLQCENIVRCFPALNSLHQPVDLAVQVLAHLRECQVALGLLPVERQHGVPVGAVQLRTAITPDVRRDATKGTFAYDSYPRAVTRYDKCACRCLSVSVSRVLDKLMRRSTP